MFLLCYIDIPPPHPIGLVFEKDCICEALHITIHNKNLTDKKQILPLNC